MLRYIVLIIVVLFVGVLTLILHFYLQNNKYESEGESKKIQGIWELQKKNLEKDLRETNVLGAFKSYEY